ncbi:MAG: hypothetical protein JGK29_05100 [Microcoleus sp. PH2017_17_BER_D_A]|nr:hypothetical protein [Microcoleus sp. PH2017_17_BER_D_A]
MTRLVRVRAPSSICFADRDRPQLPLKLENRSQMSNLQSKIKNLQSRYQNVIKITDSRHHLNVENGGDQQLASKRAAKWRLS